MSRTGVYASEFMRQTGVVLLGFIKCHSRLTHKLRHRRAFRLMSFERSDPYQSVPWLGVASHSRIIGRISISELFRLSRIPHPVTSIAKINHADQQGVGVIGFCFFESQYKGKK